MTKFPTVGQYMYIFGMIESQIFCGPVHHGNKGQHFSSTLHWMSKHVPGINKIKWDLQQ